jgi:hypothetical protein
MLLDSALCFEPDAFLCVVLLEEPSERLSLSALDKQATQKINENLLQ